MTLRERFRLGWRSLLAIAILALICPVCVVLRGLDWWIEKIALRPASNFGMQVVQVWARMTLPLLGLRLEIQGQPLRHGAMVANHASWIDIIVLLACAAPFLVAKAEVRDWPLIGLIGRTIGTVFVDRRRSFADAQKLEIQNRLRRGDLLAIFPEGTSSDGLQVLSFKSSLFGAFLNVGGAMAVALQPVSIRYVPSTDLPSEFYGWWGAMDFVQHLSAVLSRSTQGRVEIRFHPHVTLHESAVQRDRKLLARWAEGVIRDGFNQSMNDREY